MRSGGSARSRVRHTRARQIIDRDVCNRTDDDGPPIDLPSRTLELLASHGDWLNHRRGQLMRRQGRLRAEARHNQTASNM
jgi:hypothetical protein